MQEQEQEEKKPDLNDYEKKEVSKIKSKASVRAGFRNELLADERYQPYFQGFNPESVERFIKNYAEHKTNILANGPSYIRHIEEREMQWINEAYNHLDIIQQKKLFDAQCLWRAEKVKYPGVEICFDFYSWQDDVLNCPFIDPIDEEDISLYCQYLMTNNVDNDSWIDWQDYESYKEAYHTDGDSVNLPEWYEFCNGRHGTGSYLLLPDIRGEKEESYKNLARQTSSRPSAHDTPKVANKDTRPELDFYDKNQLDYFVNTFEDKETQRFHKAQRRTFAKTGEDEEISELIVILAEADEIVPIEGHYDWREAIRTCVRRYEARKIAEFLPAAFENYQLNLDMNLRQPGKDIYEDGLRKMNADLIIQGRILAGEPGNLDF